MDKIVYYKNRNGKLLDSRDVERAFWVVTGNYRFQDEVGYLKFLYDLLGKTIVSVANPTVESYIATGQSFHAIRLYRDQHGCSVSEAKRAVDDMIASMF